MSSGERQQVHDDDVAEVEIARESQVKALGELAFDIVQLRDSLQELAKQAFEIGRAVKDVRIAKRVAAK